MKRDVAGYVVCVCVGAFLAGSAIYLWTGHLIEKKVSFLEDAPRARQSQIQLEGPLPVEVASNATLSHWQDSYSEAIERCYKGVTYVVFVNGHTAVGSVALAPDGKPVPCSN